MKIKEKIQSDNLYLRSLTSHDASEEYCGWLNDKEANMYLETREATIDDLKKYIKAQNESSNVIFLGIFDKLSRSHIGNIKLESINRKDGSATIGILIGNKAYWGRGVGAETLKLMINFSFNIIGLCKIELGVIKENVKAKKVFERVGFKITKIDKKAMNHNGILHDRVWMQIKKKKLI